MHDPAPLQFAMHCDLSVELAVIGGGPAGLMAAETAAASGVRVVLFERMGSVGRKFLIAGKGGLNLTHSEPFDLFVSRFGARRDAVAGWLADFDAGALRDWARGLGIETFVGSSGRVFPSDLKAAPLLRRWVRRLRERGVAFNMHHRWLGWNGDGALRFVLPEGERCVRAAATVLALGGASWPVLGSDGAWVAPLIEQHVDMAPLQPANCGFDADWSDHFATRFAGAPVKPVALAWATSDGTQHRQQGEFVITAGGVEGSLIYLASAELRDAIARNGATTVWLDLAPNRDIEKLVRDFAKPRGDRTFATHLRRHAGIEGVKAGLVHECISKDIRDDPARLAGAIKGLPLTLRRARPVDEAISTAGGIRLEALDECLMLRQLPGTFVAGEMLDWEAPTGGYLLTASIASGRRAGAGAAVWLRERA